MPVQQFGTRPQVRIDGQPLPADQEANLIAVDVETDLTSPGRCTLVFSDPARSVLDDLGVAFDQVVEVEASAVEEAEERALFTGTVFGVDVETTESGSRAFVRAYDHSQKLRQHRQTKSWNDVTDGDLVRELAREAGVEVGDVQASGHLHPYVAQLEETAWDFLARRAQRTGRSLFMVADKLHLEKLPEAAGGPATGGYQSTDPLELVPGHNLVYLRGGVTAAAQVGDVEARGWDPRTKRELVATSTPTARGANGRTVPAEVGSAVGAQRRTVPAPGLSDLDLVEDLAEAVAGTVAGACTYLEGRTIGDPRLQAGVVVSLGECGRLDGSYTITSARHRFGPDGYHTDLQVSDRHDRSLYGLLGDGRGGGPRPGARPAIVTNIEDPEKLGRVKLAYPWLADDFETGWARVVQLGAGPERGVLWFPEVGDEVLVDHLDGDATLPVVFGGMFNGVDVAPFGGFDDQGDGKVDKRGLRTRVGHELLLDDTAGAERIEIRTADAKVTVLLDQAGRKVVIHCDGDVEVTSGGDATVRSDGNLTLRAGGDAELKAGGRVVITGTTIALN